MARTRTGLLAALAALTLPLALAPAAHADAFDRIFKEYQSTGKIDACKYSEAELKQAKDAVPNDMEAYAPEFRDILQGALEQRAGGACVTPSRPATTTTTPAAAGGTATTPAAPGSTVTPSPTPDPTANPSVSDEAIAKTALAANDSEAGAPAPVVALAVLGVLLALGGLLYGIAHWLAFDLPWARRLRHALSEAGWRAGHTWSEFTDWVRLGR
jgi:cobalamin biosynthesis Mg chelatase CobN